MNSYILIQSYIMCEHLIQCFTVATTILFWISACCGVFLMSYSLVCICCSTRIVSFKSNYWWRIAVFIQFDHCGHVCMTFTRNFSSASVQRQFLTWRNPT
jgi:hypothetical protein